MDCRVWFLHCAVVELPGSRDNFILLLLSQNLNQTLLERKYIFAAMVHSLPPPTLEPCKVCSFFQNQWAYSIRFQSHGKDQAALHTAVKQLPSLCFPGLSFSLFLARRRIFQVQFLKCLREVQTEILNTELKVTAELHRLAYVQCGSFEIATPTIKPV